MSGMIPGFDDVEHPEHYNQDGLECIDAMEASMTSTEFEGYLKGSAFKYLWRYRYKKKPAEDLKKSIWYTNKLYHSILKRENDTTTAPGLIRTTNSVQPETPQ